MNISDFEIYSTEPRKAAPRDVIGGFSASVTVFAVGENGELTELGHSAPCRYQGDAPAAPFEIPKTAEPILVVWNGSGNAPTYGRVYADGGPE